MFDLKKETIKKNIFLVLSIIFALIFIAGLIYIIIEKASPTNIIVPPALAFFLNSTLYKNSKKAIEENTKKKV